MQDRNPKTPAVVDFDFDETGRIVKTEANRPKTSARYKTLDEIRQRVLGMGAPQPRRSRPWSRFA